jgi:plastocyanin
MTKEKTMEKNAQAGLIILLLVIVVAIILIGFYYVYKPNYPTTPNQIIQNTTNPSTPTTPLTPITPKTPKTLQISIQNFAFNPQTLSINVGDTIVWTNMDSTAHTVTSDSGSELASTSISTGQTYSHKFNTAGTFAYHCSIHTSMKGTITVK